MLTVVVIILLFASLVLVHEWGHFIMAKRGGVEVEEFGFGFPPKLFGRTWRGTLYSFNLVPLGGFVRLKGEDSSQRGHGTFGAATFKSQTKILLAGVVMNLVLAAGLLYVVCLIGLPGLGSAFEPSFLHSTYAQPRQLILTNVESGSPADKLGLRKDDYVLSGNGQALTTADALLAFTKAHAGQVVSLVVIEKGTQKTLNVKLRAPGTTDGFLGVEVQQAYKLRYGPVDALIAALYITGSLLVATIVGVFQLIASLPALIIGLGGHGVPIAAQGASGPVGIFFILSSLSSLGASYILLFVANISVALAAFNILPLPALDGGRWAVLLYQKITKKSWSAEAEARYHGLGFAALIALMLIITVYDIRKYF